MLVGVILALYTGLHLDNGKGNANYDNGVILGICVVVVLLRRLGRRNRYIGIFCRQISSFKSFHLEGGSGKPKGG